jgi:predicted DNA-binding transcriptional regulator YafY
MAKTAPYASTKKRKSSNAATASTSRKLALVVELLTQRRIRFSLYHDRFRKDFRSFQRDLQQLRKIGTTYGFAISTIKDGEFVELIALDAKTQHLNKDAKRVERLLATMARALGEPIIRELGSRASVTAERDDFFTFAVPELVEGATVADTCATLREACTSPAGRAAVRFKYPVQGKKEMREREVEPYGVTVRSGSFYLVGFDRGSRGWRMFALDRFGSKPVRAGTCGTARTVPADYASNDVVGFFKGGAQRTAVTVELSAYVAPSATARRWQADQRVEHLADGRAQMTFLVSDIDEVVRWALGFGADAHVIAPAVAVERAKETSRTIAALYRA